METARQEKYDIVCNATRVEPCKGLANGKMEQGHDPDDILYNIKTAEPSSDACHGRGSPYSLWRSPFQELCVSPNNRLLKPFEAQPVHNPVGAKHIVKDSLDSK